MHLSHEDLVELYAFNRWANAKTVESVEVLTGEEYAKAIGGSFGSVRGTLIHLYGADWVWLERFHGRSPRAMPESEELSTLERSRGEVARSPGRSRGVPFDAHRLRSSPARCPTPVSTARNSRASSATPSSTSPTTGRTTAGRWRRFSASSGRALSRRTSRAGSMSARRAERPVELYCRRRLDGRGSAARHVVAPRFAASSVFSGRFALQTCSRRSPSW